ncbi:MAG: heparinase II/III family protein [Alkalilacustris sp.]
MMAAAIFTTTAQADLRAARRALRSTRDAVDWSPAPAVEGRALGQPARGRALLQGRLRLGCAALPAGGDDPWQERRPAWPGDRAGDPGATAEALHGFVWLDDLAALGGAAAREVAQRWLAGWLARFGAPRGGLPPELAWRPDLAARRLIRWHHHARLLSVGQGRRLLGPLGACAAAHGAFLAVRAGAVPAGLGRFEAALALTYAALTPGADRALRPAALRVLEDVCAGDIDAAGGLPGRNPEALLGAFSHLVWARATLEAGGLSAPPALTEALGRMAPALRALRHADGGLARFHGGGPAPAGALDLALAEAGLRPRPRPGGAMGFARLAVRRTTVIVDAAPPPPGPRAQASTLAFELTSGRRPVIVGPGPGAAFGRHWARAARATAAQATLALEGWSSARLGPAARLGDGPESGFASLPGPVRLTREGAGPAATLELSHEGWVRSHGVVHVRRLSLAADGRTLWGEDALLPLTPAQRSRFEALAGPEGVAFALRFPLHPDVAPALAADGAVRLGLRSGETWLLRADGAVPALEPSVHFDLDHPAPRPSWTVVVTGRALPPGAQIGWTLAKAEDTPVGVRDLGAGTRPGPD